MSALKFTIVLGLLLTGFSGASSARTACSEVDENVSYGLKSWSALHAAYARYKECDDGALAEGFSEAVARLMADHWTDLPQALPLFHSDPAFEAWSTRHLDCTNDYNDHVKIEELAEKSCPAGFQEFCGKLVTALKAVPAC
jgi:hypothetical protein